jgi:FecR protein
MPALRKNLTYATLSSFLLLLLLGQPSYSETPISETLLPDDILVEELFQAGSGLPVGKIQAVRGEVIVYHRDPSVAYRVKSGLPLYRGDTIRTRSSGRILCRLIDGTIFSLAPETTLAILQCNYNSARKTSVSFLALKRGDGRFQVNPTTEILSHEFKIETVTAFVQARNADFTLKTTQDSTEIITFGNSRLEVTKLAAPETIFPLIEFQRAVFENSLGPQMAHTVTQLEASILMTETDLLPRSHLFASSAEKYREKETATDASESASDVEDDRENPIPDKPELTNEN